jgi:transposase-like protein
LPDWLGDEHDDRLGLYRVLAMVIRVRDGGSVQRRALYLALGVTLDGDRDVLGMCF